MEFQGISPSGNDSSSQSFDQLGQEKIRSLRKAIEEIKTLVSERETLSKDFIDGCEKIKSSIDNFILSGRSSETDEALTLREKIDLKKKQIELSEMQMNEKITCFGDVANLKRELRDKEKELLEKEERMELLGRVLE